MELEALKRARGRDPFIHVIPDGKDGHQLADPGLPAPIGADCPDHPSYPLVIKDRQAWCRRGQHYLALEARRRG